MCNTSLKRERRRPGPSLALQACGRPDHARGFIVLGARSEVPASRNLLALEPLRSHNSFLGRELVDEPQGMNRYLILCCVVVGFPLAPGLPPVRAAQTSVA